MTNPAVTRAEKLALIWKYTPVNSRCILHGRKAIAVHTSQGLGWVHLHRLPAADLESAYQAFSRLK